MNKTVQPTGPVYMRTNHSLILALVNANLFQIRLLKRVLKREKGGVLDRDSRRKPDSRTCERKAFSERDLCVCILEMRAGAMLKPCMGQSARTVQWEQNITSQCADPDRDWEGVCNAYERT